MSGWSLSCDSLIATYAPKLASKTAGRARAPAKLHAAVPAASSGGSVALLHHGLVLLVHHRPTTSHQAGRNAASRITLSGVLLGVLPGHNDYAHGGGGSTASHGQPLIMGRHRGDNSGVKLSTPRFV